MQGFNSRTILVGLFSLAMVSDLYAQTSPNFIWQLRIGGSSNDYGIKLDQCEDGGYITLSQTRSSNGDAIGNHGLYDLLVIKLDSNGILQWSRCMGGTNDELASDVKQTPDGGFLVAASTLSMDGDVNGNHGEQDGWLVKLNGEGQIQWQRCVGGSEHDEISAIELTVDGGCFAVGTSRSNDGDAVGNHGGEGRDLWTLRLDSTGVPLWTTLYGGTGADAGADLQLTDDEGCLVLGNAGSLDGNVSNPIGLGDVWLLKLDAAGTLEWEHSYGGTQGEQGVDLIATSDGFAFNGWTSSNDVDVLGNHGAVDYWVAGVDADGVLSWQACYGGTENDFADGITLTSDGGFLIYGGTNSDDGDITNFHGGTTDGWLVKLNGTGDLLWQSAVGGSEWEVTRDVLPLANGGLVFIGGTSSTDGDATGGLGAPDAWLVKLGAESIGVDELTPVQELEVFPVPTTGVVQVQGRLPLAGEVRLAVLDAVGRVVVPVQVQSAAAGMRSWSVDLTALTPGAYWLRLVADGHSQMRPLLRQ